MSLESIRSLVETDLAATNQFLKTEFTSPIPLINEVVEHVINAGGKRIRPLVVLLSAKATNHMGTQHITLAAAIELFHTATLLHDDVVDNSSLRRGSQTANALWGNEASVLVGDFIYSRSFQLIVKLENLRIMSIFSDATNVIAEGEALQLTNARNADISEQSYFEVIQRKTGKLFEVSAQLGPALTNAPQDQFLAMQLYGMNLGIAYQLIDDALDYRASTKQMGKNKGNDLAEGKATLPLIYALKKGTPVQAKFIKDALQYGKQETLIEVLSIIENAKGIEYTASIAKEYALKAQEHLKSIPDNTYKQGLIDLANFVVAREF